MKKCIQGTVIIVLTALISMTAFASFETAIETTPSQIYDIEKQDPVLNFTFGLTDLSLEFRLPHEKFTVGPYISFSYFDYLLLSAGIISFGFGARLNYFFTGENAFSDSWYLSPFAGYHIMATTLGSNIVFGSPSCGALIGYQWIWPSGFNFSIEAGFDFISSGINMPFITNFAFGFAI